MTPKKFIPESFDVVATVLDSENPDGGTTFVELLDEDFDIVQDELNWQDFNLPTEEY